MKPMFRLLCLCLLLLAIPGEAWARGASSRGGSFSGGSSSRSSSSSSSSGRSSFGGGSSSGGSSWGSSTRSSGGSSGNSSSSWGSSSRFSPSSSSTRSSSTDTSSSTQRSAPSSSATDAALARKVGQGGSKFSSRSEAVSDFQQKHAAEYPSTFSSQPGSRPSYIPQTTIINGGSYPVYYNPAYGGYGSMIGGHWSAYDVMRDAIMLNALMGNHNYYYGGGYNDYGGRPVYYSHSSGGGIFVGLVFIIILVIVAVVAVNYLSSRRAVSGNPFGAAASNAGGAAPPPLRNLKTSPMDKSKAADWLAVKPNSVVTISDAQGIADSMKRGQGVRGIDYTVRSIGRLMQIDGLSTHLFFTLNDEEQVTYLLVKIVDDLIDLGLYFEVDGLQPGTRQEMVDRGALWLFQQPANPNNFQVADLQYTTTIRQTLPKTGGGSEEVIYDLKAQGELQCNYSEQPPRSGMAGDALATIVEYRTPQAVENPEFLILEIGEKRGPSSYLQFFLGCPIKFSEVDVLPV